MLDTILKFIPPIRRPWNSAYHDTYDAMSDRDRRISRLYDICVVLLVLAFVGIAWHIP